MMVLVSVEEIAQGIQTLQELQGAIAATQGKRADYISDDQFPDSMAVA
jgi:hypothetical protein